MEKLAEFKKLTKDLIRKSIYDYFQPLFALCNFISEFFKVFINFIKNYHYEKSKKPLVASPQNLIRFIASSADEETFVVTKPLPHRTLIGENTINLPTPTINVATQDEIVVTKSSEKSIKDMAFPKSDFVEVNIESAILNEVDLSGVSLVKAQLSSVQLKNSNLDHINLSSAIMCKAVLTGSNLQKAQLIETNLENALMNRVNLEDADLRRANLKNANLKNANLKNANLRDTDLRGSNLFGSNLSKDQLALCIVDATTILPVKLSDEG